jgi:hypothetical protein
MYENQWNTEDMKVLGEPGCGVDAERFSPSPPDKTIEQRNSYRESRFLSTCSGKWIF